MTDALTDALPMCVSQHPNKISSLGGLLTHTDAHSLPTSVGGQTEDIQGTRDTPARGTRWGNASVRQSVRAKHLFSNDTRTDALENASVDLEALARRVVRLSPDRRDPERFHVEKDELAAELRRLARRWRAA